jgi:hypothetical protein
MVLRGNHDRVNIVPGEHLAKITVQGATSVPILGVHNLLGPLAPVRVSVAHRHHLAIRQFQKVLHIVRAHPAHADAAECYTVTGRHGAILAEGPPRDNVGQGKACARGERSGYKVTTVHFEVHKDSFL